MIIFGLLVVSCWVDFIRAQYLICYKIASFTLSLAPCYAHVRLYFSYGKISTFFSAAKKTRWPTLSCVLDGQSNVRSQDHFRVSLYLDRDFCTVTSCPCFVASFIFVLFIGNLVNA